jgi:enoyl-CoA hydratase
MSNTDIVSQSDIVCEKRGAAGCVLLNRPKALNALNHDMVEGLAAALDAWENDSSIERIVVRGAGDRAFCAGGDIRLMYELGKAGDHARQISFWRAEYILNQRIARYPKPYVALIDGIDMGGGAGVSIHGSHRVVSEKLMFAMPEVGIGFFPDVGSTYFLPKLPGRIGVWLAVTGARIGAGDACAFGLATSYTASSKMNDLARALEASGDTDAILESFAEPAPTTNYASEQPLIDAAFAHDNVAAVVAALQNAASGGSNFARETLTLLSAKSPTSVAIGLRQMRIGRGLSIEDALRVEARIAARICLGHDFYEGVRAVIIDKDNQPRWKPSRHEDVEPSVIDAYFAPMQHDDELRFDGQRQ